MFMQQWLSGLGGSWVESYTRLVWGAGKEPGAWLPRGRRSHRCHFWAETEESMGRDVTKILQILGERSDQTIPRDPPGSKIP